MSFVPSYLKLLLTGELRQRGEQLESLLGACTVCPHNCRIDRLKDKIARCYSGYLPIVSSYTPHFGEEPLLVGTHGVGNIFFGNCNLRCVYCQNHLISQQYREERRREVSFERLAGMMLELQEQGCHAIGFVSPTHFVPQIVRSLEIAVQGGLTLPLVYNTNAFDSPEVLRLLDGIIDIYLPDFKYSDDDMGYRFSKIRDYPRHARGAIREMHRQVGSNLVIGEDGLVKRGLIIRHLVLPNDIAGSKETLRWVMAELGACTTLSVMSQYFPAHRALTVPLLDRKIRESEYERVIGILEDLGMDNGWVQEYESSGHYRPEFKDRERPFRDAESEECRMQNEEKEDMSYAVSGGTTRENREDP